MDGVAVEAGVVLIVPMAPSTTTNRREAIASSEGDMVPGAVAKQWRARQDHSDCTRVGKGG